MDYNSVIVIPKKMGLSYKGILGNMKEHKRSGTAIKETANKLTITIKTNDATAMRASINAIMRDIQVIENSSKPPST
jgi:tRNA threonylcarbamoyladenosine modification (KEOPS) complex  Pcc1 subunit